MVFVVGLGAWVGKDFAMDLDSVIGSTLYSRWLAVVVECPNAVAVWSSGEAWTFAKLAAEVGDDGRGVREVRPISGGGVDFLIEVLRAWRDGAVVWPQDSVARSDTGGVSIGDLPEGVVHLKSTSGSTGASKLVMFDATALQADAAQIMEVMEMSRVRPNVVAVSLAHSYGFSNLVLPLLLHGVPIWFAKSPLPAAVRNVLAAVDDKCTLAAVPAMWLAWHRAGVIAEFGAKVATAISAGAPLPLALEREVFELAGVKIHNFYGSSECGGIAYDESSSPREDTSCIGKVMPAAKVMTNDEGCLEVRGDAVAMGYHGGVGADVLGGGVFRTSDLARLNGVEVFLTGRVDDMINVAGRKISPARIEAVLKASPLVDEVLVFGVDCADQAREQQIVAVISPLAAEDEVLSDIKSRCAEALATWQCPRDWWVTPELTVDARGKLSRAVWRERWHERGRDSSRAISHP